MLGKLAGAALLAVALVAGLALMLQLLRLGHHLAGATLAPSALLAMVAASLPTLLLYALPLGLFAGVLFALGGLAEGRQLLAAEAGGTSATGVAIGAALWLAAPLGAAAGGAAYGEPAALEWLHQTAATQAARSLVLGAAPRTFVSVGDGTTISFEAAASDGHRGARLEGLMLARGGAKEVLFARQARLRFAATALAAELDLRDVEIQSKRDDGGLRRLRAARLRDRLELGPAIGPHFGFLLERAREARRAPRRRAAAAVASCLALGLVAVALVRLTRGRRLRAAALGALLAAAYLVGAAWLQRLAWPAELAWAALWAAAATASALRARRWS